MGADILFTQIFGVGPYIASLEKWLFLDISISLNGTSANAWEISLGFLPTLKV